MTGDALRPGKKIILTRSDNGEMYSYTITKQLGTKDTGRSGAVKAVYVAEKQSTDISSENKKQTVVLKEFFPKISENGIIPQDIQRNADGSVVLSSTNNQLNAIKQNFIKEAKKLKEYKGYPEMETQISAPKDVCILEGNGTFYFENDFHEGAASWKELKGENQLKADEILLIALHCFRFLNKMHLHNDALVDFKPADVLLGYNQLHDEYEFSSPMFYDFGSVLPINHEYHRSDIWCTRDYAPRSFSSGEMVDVNNDTERITFLKVCRDMLTGCKEKIGISKREEINSFFDPDKRENIERSEVDTENGLNMMRKHIQEAEYKFKRDNLPKKNMFFTIIQIIVSAIVLGIYSAMGFILSYLCINADVVRKFIEERGISEILIAVVLSAGTFFIFGLRLLIDWMSERIARLHTSVEYFNKKDSFGNEIRNGDFNSFRYGWRRKTTFQDKSRHNKKRQHQRWFLWSCLLLVIILGLVLSIVLTAFPLFLAVGCITIIAFMYVEYLPSAKDFFYSCCYPNTKKKYPTTRLQEAYYFKNEYKESQVNGKYRPFDLNSDYYENNCRNLLKIRQAVKERFDADPRFDLGFNHFQMRHIYKMTFDRLRNVQLIVNLSVLVVMLTTVFIDFMGFTGKLEAYFRIPHEAYIYVTLVLITIVTLVSIFQIVISRRYEKVVADVSYKSRYVISDSLNELLVEDVVNGIVKNIDIVRGINQAEAAINTINDKDLVTGEEQYRKAELRKKYRFTNRRLVHHEVIANQRRLAIAVWLSFVAVTSILVWLCKIYWLFPILLITTTIINFFGHKYIVELIERKRIIRSIHDLEKYERENKAK